MGAKACEDKFLDYVEGRLPAQEAREFEEQLQADGELRRSLDAYRAVLAAERDLHQVSGSLEAGFDVKVMQAVERAGEGLGARLARYWREHRRLVLTAGASLATLVLVLKVGIDAPARKLASPAAVQMEEPNALDAVQMEEQRSSPKPPQPAPEAPAAKSERPRQQPDKQQKGLPPPEKRREQAPLRGAGKGASDPAVPPGKKIQNLQDLQASSGRSDGRSMDESALRKEAPAETKPASPARSGASAGFAPAMPETAPDHSAAARGSELRRNAAPAEQDMMLSEREAVTAGGGGSAALRGHRRLAAQQKRAQEHHGAAPRA